MRLLSIAVVLVSVSPSLAHATNPSTTCRLEERSASGTRTLSSSVTEGSGATVGLMNTIVAGRDREPTAVLTVEVMRYVFGDQREYVAKVGGVGINGTQINHGLGEHGVLVHNGTLSARFIVVTGAARSQSQEATQYEVTCGTD